MLKNSAPRTLTVLCVFVAMACENPPPFPGGPGIGSGGLASNANPSSLPRWVNTPGAHPEYPDREYLVAVGSSNIGKSESDARETAGKSALGKLLLILRAEVEQDVVTSRRYSGEVRGDDVTSRLDVSLDEFTRIVGRGTLDGAEVVVRFVDRSSRTVYALAAMHRKGAARAISNRIGAQLDEAGQQLALAEKSLESRRVRALGPLLQAYRLYLESRVSRSTFAVLVGAQFGRQDEDQGARVRALLEEFVADLRIEVAEGQGQRAAVGASLEAITLRVTLDDEGGAAPVPGMRLRVTPEHPEEVRLASDYVVTGRSGKARVRVPFVGYTGRPANKIGVFPEAAALGTLDLPRVNIEYSLPTRETLRVLVVIDEKSLGTRPRVSEVQSVIEDRAGKAGYLVIDSRRVGKAMSLRQILDASAAELRKGIGESVDVLIRGSAGVEKGGRIAGLPRVTAVVRLEVLDLVSSRVVLAKTLSEPDGYRPGEAAGAALRALRFAGKDAAKASVTRLDKFLSSGE